MTQSVLGHRGQAVLEGQIDKVSHVLCILSALTIPYLPGEQFKIRVFGCPWLQGLLFRQSPWRKTCTGLRSRIQMCCCEHVKHFRWKKENMYWNGWNNKRISWHGTVRPKVHISSQNNLRIWKWRQIATNWSTQHEVLWIKVAEPRKEGVLLNTKQLLTLLTQLLHSVIGCVKRNLGCFIKHAQASLVHFTLPPGGVKVKQPLKNTDLGGSSPAVSLDVIRNDFHLWHKTQINNSSPLASNPHFSKLGCTY